MDGLQAVVAYWLDCIKSEGALEQSFAMASSTFGLAPRMRARLFTGTSDPFIFRKEPTEYVMRKDSDGYSMLARAKLKGLDIHFGYPLLMFFDRGSDTHQLAPLFVVRLEAAVQEASLTLQRTEPSPVLGNKAFAQLGLKQEEVAALNAAITEIFERGTAPKLETVLYMLKRETKLQFAEGIDPDHLSQEKTTHPYTGAVVYNRALFYVSEASVYNLHTLDDLEKLVRKKDIPTTALRYITAPTPGVRTTYTPVLPFAFDEYQLMAMKKVLGGGLSVITGPPGTGKSQFIANLIINLFLQRKRVLLVSHTGEAVRVVNERINSQFTNLMMQTGKKEIRQDLGRRLEEMVQQYNRGRLSAVSQPCSDRDIVHSWKDIQREVDYIRKTNSLHKNLGGVWARHEGFAHRHDILAQSSRRLLNLYASLLARRLTPRRSNREVLQTLAQLKERHSSLSREYVAANYLSLILENGLYGKLLAYIEAVQSRRFMDRESDASGERYIQAALKAMNIWSCTLKSLAATFPLSANLFDYVIFDEASQIDMPSAAPALYRAQHAVVVGDENQLSHIARISPKTEEVLAAKYNLAAWPFYPALVRYTDTSLFHSAKRALTEPEQELRNHYRSHASIAALFNNVFYGDRLTIYEPETSLPDEITPGVHWIDVKGAAYKYATGSRYNSKEVSSILKLLDRLIPLAREYGCSIGVVTPYSRQRDLIAEAVAKKWRGEELGDVRILTVHQFQGSEVDILLFSIVLADQGDGNSDYWFVKNRQILNVAISRARQLLLLVGDRSFAHKSDSKLKDIADYCERPAATDRQVPNRPINTFEKRLLLLLRSVVSDMYTLEPQYVIGGRFTVDFAVLTGEKKIAIELDGHQHEIIGGFPVFEDRRRDEYLAREGWQVIRIRVDELLRQPDKVAQIIGQAISLA